MLHAEVSELPGWLLGTEKDLAEEFGVSRVTVRKAIDLLARDGLVEPRRGRGRSSFPTHPTGRPSHAPPVPGRPAHAYREPGHGYEQCRSRRVTTGRGAARNPRGRAVHARATLRRARRRRNE